MTTNDDMSTLDFEDFNQPSGDANGTIFDDTTIPLDDEIPRQQPKVPSVDADVQQTTAAPATNAFWTIDFYQPYFNVDTNQVLDRLWRSFAPFKMDFLDRIRASSPDMYGPFWLCTSLLVILVIASDLAGLNLYSSISKAATAPIMVGNSTIANPFNVPGKPVIEWTRDFSVVSVGCSVLYSFLGVVPVILWALMKYKGINISLMESVCIYGYSLSVVIPFSIICIVNINWLRWVLLMISFSVSASFIIVSMLGEWKKSLSDAKDGLFLILLPLYVFVLHMGLAIFTKFFFFSFSLNK
ncbi:hypothetical protein AKO1_011675 [Acrasis kona]|uniref:Protein YIPF n=1 Tax=Acrasis kona TaxID=1008807 RepID=A0AAW2Z992_9EUKA